MTLHRAFYPIEYLFQSHDPKRRCMHTVKKKKSRTTLPWRKWGHFFAPNSYKYRPWPNEPISWSASHHWLIFSFIMALRNYLYAKHLDPHQVLLIDHDPNMTSKMSPKVTPRLMQPGKRIELHPETQLTSCPPERQLVLEDGSKACANCADCPKKTATHDGNPKIKVQWEELSSQVHELRVGETDYTHLG